MDLLKNEYRYRHLNGHIWPGLKSILRKYRDYLQSQIWKPRRGR